MKGDLQHLGASLQSLASRRDQRRREASDREALLRTEFTTNAASRESETTIMIDRALQHQQDLGRVNSYMDDVLGQGAEILKGLQVNHVNSPLPHLPGPSSRGAQARRAQAQATLPGTFQISLERAFS